jgi:TPR repeat protein
MRKCLFVFFLLIIICSAGLAQSDERDLALIYNYQKKAEAGDVEAQTDLGIIYSSGNTGLIGSDFPKDYKKAHYWLTKAVENGSMSAPHYLAGMFIDGLGCEKDLTKSNELMLLAAKRGHSASQLLLGDRYIHGSEGYEMDWAKGMAWFIVASEKSSSQDEIQIIFGAEAEGRIAKFRKQISEEDWKKACKLAEEIKSDMR